MPLDREQGSQNRFSAGQSIGRPEPAGTQQRWTMESFRAPPAPLPPRDTAVEELRIRYARGELEREDFAQRMRDLGGADIGGRASPIDPPVPPDDSTPASG